MESTTTRVAAGLILVVTLAAGIGLAGGSADGAVRRDAAVRLIGADDVAAAAASTVPERPTMSDEIDHYEARLVRRDGEGFSHGRLYAARLLRFRAYGEPRDLAAAESHLLAWDQAGGDAAAIASAFASLRLTQHRFADAMRAARTAARQAGANPDDLAYTLFDASWATGRTHSAELLLQQPHDTTSIAWLSRKARVLDRQGKVAQARDLFRLVLATVQAYAEPPAVEAWALVELGHFEFHAGDPAAAVARYREALEVLPGDPAAIEGLAGVALGVDRDPDVAARLYRMALERGGHLDIMPVLAEVEAERGDLDAAAVVRDAFIHLATADEQATHWYRRPLVFVLADRPATTCKALELALQDFMDRQDAGAWDAIAWARYRLGDVTAAYQAASVATAEGTPEPGVALRAGIIARAAGQFARSEVLLRIALDGATELTVAEVTEANRLLAGGVPDVPIPVACDDAVPSRAGRRSGAVASVPAAPRVVHDEEPGASVDATRTPGLP